MRRGMAVEASSGKFWCVKTCFGAAVCGLAVKAVRGKVLLVGVVSEWLELAVKAV